MLCWWMIRYLGSESARSKDVGSGVLPHARYDATVKMCVLIMVVFVCLWSIVFAHGIWKGGMWMTAAEARGRQVSSMVMCVIHSVFNGKVRENVFNGNVRETYES